MQALKNVGRAAVLATFVVVLVAAKAAAATAPVVVAVVIRNPETPPGQHHFGVCTSSFSRSPFLPRKISGSLHLCNLFIYATTTMTTTEFLTQQDSRCVTGCRNGMTVADRYRRHPKLFSHSDNEPLIAATKRATVRSCIPSER